MRSFPVDSPLAQEVRPLPRGWIIVALLWVVGCLNYLDRLILTTIHDSITTAIPMSEKEFGGLTTVFLFVYAVLSPLGGWCADRFGRSRVIILSVAVWSVVTLLTSFARTYPELLATRALMGISEACYIPAALALIADYHRGQTRSLATGIHMSGIYAGMALGGLGGWMADRFGWSTGFFTFGCVGIVYAGVLALLLKDVAHPQDAVPSQAIESPLQSIGALGRNRQFWLISLYWGVLGFAGWSFSAWMPVFLREHFHLTQTKAGFTATSYMQVAAFLGVLVGGAWADRWSLTSLRARVWVPMIALTLAAPFVFMVSWADALWLVILGLMAYGFARGCSDANMMPILCQVAEPRHRATGYGLINFFSCAMGGIASFLGGWLRDKGVDLSWLLMGAGFVTLFSGLTLLWVKPTRPG